MISKLTPTEFIALWNGPRNERINTSFASPDDISLFTLRLSLLLCLCFFFLLFHHIKIHILHFFFMEPPPATTTTTSTNIQFNAVWLMSLFIVSIHIGVHRKKEKIILKIHEDFFFPYKYFYYNFDQSKFSMSVNYFAGPVQTWDKISWPWLNRSLPWWAILEHNWNQVLMCVCVCVW